MLRSFVYTVVSLLSSSPPCLISYHASLLCLFLRFHFVYSPLPINMYICTYMHAHIHVNAYIGSGRSMACKDRSSNRSSDNRPIIIKLIISQTTESLGRRCGRHGNHLLIPFAGRRCMDDSQSPIGRHWSSMDKSR